MIPDFLKYRESLPGSVTEIRAEEHRISLRWVAPNCSAVTRHAVSEGGRPGPSGSTDGSEYPQLQYLKTRSLAQ